MSVGDGATVCGISDLKRGHRLYCWGDNSHKQVEVPGALTKQEISLLSVGRYHVCAVTKNMPTKMQCWGRDSEHQTQSPGLPKGAARWAAMSSGAWHSCATTDDGELRCWGCSVPECYKFGHGQTKPPPLPTGSRWRPTSIKSGGFVSCALVEPTSAPGDSPTKLLCWGSDVNGQATVPSGFSSSWVAVAPGRYGTCGLLGSATPWGGRVVCWGIRGLCREKGGAGHCKDDPAATVVPSSTLPFAAVVAGAWHACAINQDGTLRCFGSNTEGQCNVPKFSAVWEARGRGTKN